MVMSPDPAMVDKRPTDIECVDTTAEQDQMVDDWVNGR